MNVNLFNRDDYELTREQEQAILKDRIDTAIDRGDVIVYRAFESVPYEGDIDFGIFATHDEALKALKRELRKRTYISDNNGFYVEAIVVGYPELRQDWTEVRPGQTAKGNLSLKAVSLV